MFEAVDLASITICANIYLSLVVCAVHTRHDSDCRYLRVDICVYR